MFASVWQLLTAIFFISALTKLLYKLIKHSNDHTHPAAAAREQGLRQVGEQRQGSGAAEAEAEVGLDLRQAAALGQQQEGGGSAEELARVGEANEARESVDVEEELGELLERRSPGPEERSLRLERQRRRRHFRRQLRAILSDGGATRANLHEAEPPRVAGSTSSGPTSRTLAQSATGQQVDALQLLTRRQNVVRPAGAQQSNRDKEAPSGGEFFSTSVGEPARARKLQTLGETASRRTLWPNFGRHFGANRGQSGPRRVATLFAIILIDTLLLEPVKLFTQLFSGSLRIFCCLLDAIEGIEPAAEENSPESDEAEAEEEAVQQQQQQQQVGLGGVVVVATRSPGAKRALRRPQNYFNRRYLSRRSLSAALLDEQASFGSQSSDDEEKVKQLLE